MNCTKSVKTYTIEFADRELADIEMALKDRAKEIRDWVRDHSDGSSPKLDARANRLENLSVEINHVRLRPGD